MCRQTFDNTNDYAQQTFPILVNLEPDKMPTHEESLSSSCSTTMANTTAAAAAAVTPEVVEANYASAPSPAAAYYQYCCFNSNDDGVGTPATVSSSCSPSFHEEDSNSSNSCSYMPQTSLTSASEANLSACLMTAACEAASSQQEEPFYCYDYQSQTANTCGYYEQQQQHVSSHSLPQYHQVYYDPYYYGPQRLPTVFEEENEDEDADEIDEQDEQQHEEEPQGSSSAYTYRLDHRMIGATPEDAYCFDYFHRQSLQEEQEEECQSSTTAVSGCQLIRPQAIRVVRPQAIRAICPTTIAPVHRPPEYYDNDMEPDNTTKALFASTNHNNLDWYRSLASSFLEDIDEEEQPDTAEEEDNEVRPHPPVAA